MRPLPWLIVLALTVSACNPLEILEGPRPWPNERRILARDWVVPQVEDEAEPVYCYRTLGRVDCYNEPLSDKERVQVVAPPESMKAK